MFSENSSINFIMHNGHMPERIPRYVDLDQNLLLEVVHKRNGNWHVVKRFYADIKPLLRW